MELPNNRSRVKTIEELAKTLLEIEVSYDIDRIVFDSFATWNGAPADISGNDAGPPSADATTSGDADRSGINLSSADAKTGSNDNSDATIGSNNDIDTAARRSFSGSMSDSSTSGG